MFAFGNPGDPIPLYVPLIFLAWGVMLWFVAGRKMLRDPRGEIHKMADSRARSRLVRSLGGSGDPETEFQQLWRTRWLIPVVAVFYSLGVVWMFAKAILD